MLACKEINAGTRRLSRSSSYLISLPNVGFGAKRTLSQIPTDDANDPFQSLFAKFCCGAPAKNVGELLIQPVVNKIRRPRRIRTEPNQVILVLQGGRIMVSTRAVAQPTKEDIYG